MNKKISFGIKSSFIWISDNLIILFKVTFWKQLKLSHKIWQRMKPSSICFKNLIFMFYNFLYCFFYKKNNLATFIKKKLVSKHLFKNQMPNGITSYSVTSELSGRSTHFDIQFSSSVFFLNKNRRKIKQAIKWSFKLIEYPVWPEII